MAGRNIKGITVEIGGDTTGLQNALKQVNSEIKNTQSQLKDVEKLLKMDPGNTELLAQKQRLLSDAVNETKEKLSTLKTAAEQANTALANGDISQEQYDALQREIAETEQALKDLETQAGQSATALQKVAATGEQLQTVGDKISGIGEKLMPVSVAVVGLGTAAVKTAADFDTAMSKVAAVSGAAGDDLEALRDKAREMGEKTKFSASEAAEAMNYMAMAGWKTSDMLSGIEGIMNLAAASGEDLATTSDIVTDALSAFGLTAADSGHFADILAAASSNANTNVSMMGETFKYAAPVAGALGYSVDDVAEAIGLMANSGIKASSAGTALRTILTSLQGEIKLSGNAIGDVVVQTTNADGSMRSLGDILSDTRDAFSGLTEAEASATAEALVGKNAMSGFLALMNSSPSDIEKLQSAIENSDGAAENMADIMQDNLSGQLTILKSQLSELAISFGEILMPIIRDVVSGLQSFMDKLNGMDDKTKKTITVVGGIVAAIGPVLIVVGKVVSAVGTIMTIVPKVVSAIKVVKGAIIAINAVLMANPIGLIVAAIGAVVAGLVVLYNKCEWFRDGVNSVFAQVKQFFMDVWDGMLITFTETIPNAWNNLVSFLQGIPEWWNGLWQGVSDTFSSKWSEIMDNPYVQTVVETLTSVWENAVTTLKGIWDGLTEYASGVFELLKNVILGPIILLIDLFTGDFDKLKEDAEKIWGGILDSAEKIFGGLFTIVSAIVDGLSGHISAVFGGIGDFLQQAIGDAFNFIKGLPAQALEWGKDFIGGLVDGIRSGIDKVKQVASDVGEGIRTFLHFSRPDEGPLADYETWMPDFMNGLAKGIEDGKSVIKDAVSSLASEFIINPTISAMETSGMVGGTMNHTGTIRVEGVNNEGQMVAVSDYVIEDAITRILGREARMY